MESEIVIFLASLAAVCTLVAFAHLLGFSQSRRIASRDEVVGLLRLSPGGFEPTDIALDSQGFGAIACDSAGKHAVVLPHGGQFVVRRLDASARISADDGILTICATELGAQPVQIKLGEIAGVWADSFPTAR